MASGSVSLQQAPEGFWLHHLPSLGSGTAAHACKNVLTEQSSTLKIAVFKAAGC